MERMGNCGRSARHYGDELAVLYGLLTMEDEVWPRTVPPVSSTRQFTPPKRCEHGVLLRKQCPTCAFMFGWQERRAHDNKQS
jgi:hypothetical protein